MQVTTRNRAQLGLAVSVVLVVAVVGFIYLKHRTSGPYGCMVPQSVPAKALIKSGCIISDGDGPSPQSSTALTVRGTLRLAWTYVSRPGPSPQPCTFVIKVTPSSGGGSVPDITGGGPQGAGSKTLHITGQYVIAPGFACGSDSTPAATSHWHLTVAE